MSRATRYQRRSNNHHLVWPDKQQIGIYRKVRDLPCCQVILDVQVHMVLHKIYGPPKVMDYADAEMLINRHHIRECACFLPHETRTNILEINRPVREDD